METDTVRISEESLKSTIEREGKFVLYSIYFDTGKSIILPKSRATLETMSKFLKNNSGKQFFIVGHTDATGTFSNNMYLSERRAAAVVNALQTQFGISQTQLQPKGVGPLAPVATNQTADGRKLNRRVEMVLILRE
jgi:outer membrane protein OmpA-like peptidoglycan-associated protein